MKLELVSGCRQDHVPAGVPNVADRDPLKKLPSRLTSSTRPFRARHLKPSHLKRHLLRCCLSMPTTPTTQTSKGGEAKTKNGKGVYKSPSGKTCYRSANSQGCN